MATANEFKLEYRSVIKFLCKEGCTATEIHLRMTNVYGSECPSYATVTRWFNEFKRGRTEIQDDQRSGRPTTSTDWDHSAQAELLIMNNRRIKVSEIASELNISYGSTFTIIHDILGMSKVSARWVPRNLSIQDRHHRLHSSEELLGLIQNNPEDFFARLGLEMRLGFTSGIQRPNNSRCNGGVLILPLPKNLKLSVLPEK